MQGEECKDEDATSGQELEVLLGEYGALKSEQSARIGFRDNLLYVTVGAVGAVTSVALGGFGGGGGPMYVAFLVVPWVTAILGWTYLVNDQKITAIRMYVEDELAKRVKRSAKARQALFGWEGFHRRDGRRKLRKWIQLVIDLLTFVFSGMAAIAAYVAHVPPDKREGPAWALVLGEIILLVLLGVLFFDSAREASRPKPR
ncbi:hypothetical protein [Polyangium sp. y55x31]|uniref:hypothetical protein n=1 Tax=Polyangium sp. y55x31 TaxID=3042688 RepID=UPI002482D7F4|nr:hypothetical protein [Polyangium sp. y55x31]MDI1479811.1 hypothetical protein [Polyangium sp. y55x31]